MRILSEFRFDHAPTDSDRDAAVLRELAQRGVELGALVTLWYCPPCDFAQADFDYDYPKRRRDADA